ncbi:MAG: ROK family protein [Candidatus Hydrogenedentes bacterium]|nr:ROK family protein [Candidatus Hydrogenedentota bacterium]
MDDLIIGADLGGTKLLFVYGQQTFRVDTGPSFSPEDFAMQLKSFIAASNLRSCRIGIAVPGLVSPDGQVVACDVLPALTGWRPADTLKALGSHIAVINDVNAALLEEMHDVPENFTGGIVMAGTAIGSAFIAHGRALQGASGWAGELGYLPYPTGGQVKRLDEVAGSAAIAAKLGVDAPTLAKLAGERDTAALTIIREGGYALGIGLATVINLLNPSLLAVGGGMLKFHDYYDAALSSAESSAIPELWRDCRVASVRAGANVVALGAIRAAAAKPVAQAKRVLSWRF